MIPGGYEDSAPVAVCRRPSELGGASGTMFEQLRSGAPGWGGVGHVAMDDIRASRADFERRGVEKVQGELDRSTRPGPGWLLRVACAVRGESVCSSCLVVYVDFEPPVPAVC